VYAPLAVVVVATALFGAGVVRGRVRRPSARSAPGDTDLEQVQGFVLVGSGALALLGVAVPVVGLFGLVGQAEAMGVLGLLAYLLYLVIAVLVVRRTSRRVARRAAAWEQPPAGTAGDAG